MGRGEHFSFSGLPRFRQQINVATRLTPITKIYRCSIPRTARETPALRMRSRNHRLCQHFSVYTSHQSFELRTFISFAHKTGASMFFAPSNILMRSLITAS